MFFAETSLQGFEWHRSVTLGYFWDK